MFNYLRDILYNPTQATLNLDDLDEDFKKLGEALIYFGNRLGEQRELAKALSRGQLDVELPPPGNELAAPLKSLHASLKHMTWQSQQVAKGDYKQRIDFMGEFSEAFNTMTMQLDARQSALEREIEISHEKTKALEHSNSLLTNITFNIPQQIIVVGRASGEILYRNKAAMEADESTILELMRLADETDMGVPGRFDLEVARASGENKGYLSVDFYSLHFQGMEAKAFVVNDVSADRERVKKLEHHAYQDDLTKLHNRFSGMQLFHKWLDEGRHFVLCFADLDNLKYVNDSFGHSEGDKYLINAANYLNAYSENAIVCRLGGDEFMMLIPDATAGDVQARMREMRDVFIESCRKKNLGYRCSISYGIVEVTPGNKLSAGSILSLADERMYRFKRKHKK
ncbi:MAG: diguanylate cyclase [Oscillospiraceae bacterium]|jgi:diguanylate cyclase (GGDEF)-like protein|nr:diguanylate cyclase [Oscillospiraceae bacterium]